MISDREKYLFDVQGFLVISDVLESGEIERCMEAVKANWHLRGEDEDVGSGGSTFLEGGKRGVFSDLLTWEKPWCDPFRDLLVHRKLIPYLNTFLGRGWHADVPPFLHHHTNGSEGLALHLGNPNLSGGAYYSCGNGQIRNGLMVVQYTLSDQLEGQGGFCCIPGSHKSNFGRPHDISLMESNRELVVNPAAKAGDVIIFTEACTHGTVPWRAEHDRYAIHYRYTSKWVMFGPGFGTHTFPAWVDELTETQRAVLEPAYFPNRPLINDDGTLERPPFDPDEQIS